MLAIALTASAPSAAGEATTALQVCGTLRQHQPAAASVGGALTIGTRSYVVAPGTVAGNGGVTVAIGGDLCVQASQGGTTGQLVYYLFFPLRPGDRACGNHLASTQTATTIAADFGELTLRRGSAVPPGQGTERICYALEVDRPSGDLVATGVLPIRDIDRERVSHCGTVSAYTRATATSSGSLVIGSRSYRIAAGVAYTGDPAGDRTDRTAVGSNVCLGATLGTGGEIVEYLTGPFRPNTGGVVIAYTLPSGGRSGIATLSYGSRSTLRIPAAIDAAVDLSRGGSHCFSTTVDGSGDMSASAVIQCQQGVATGPGPATGAPSPAVATSPSPSATTSATPAPTPTLTPSATPSPAGDVATSTTVRVGPDPLLLAGVMGLAALGILAIYLARRRGR